jgi:ribonuclease D
MARMASDFPPPVVVAGNDQLRRLLPTLQASPELAVDTESNSLYAYRERVCLIQLSTVDMDILIDPFAVDDLSPLAPVLTDARIEKIFHAAEYDLACLRRDFGFAVVNLFDTRVAARTLGRTRTGLGDLLEETFGVHLDKRHQRANWGKRPLPPSLLDYARLDTHYLIALRHRLADELQHAGREAEAREECERIALAPAPSDRDDGAGFWRITNSRKLRGPQVSVLRELYALREAEAARRDCPPFKVVGDAALMAVATALPRTRAELDALREVPATARQRHGAAWLAAVRRGLETPPPPRPSNRNGDEASLARFQRLREWRRVTAAARGVESDLILPRDMAWEIARANPGDLDGLHRLMTPLETRFAAHGPAILDALHACAEPNGQRQ